MVLLCSLWKGGSDKVLVWPAMPTIGGVMTIEVKSPWIESPLWKKCYILAGSKGGVKTYTIDSDREMAIEPTHFDWLSRLTVSPAFAECVGSGGGVNSSHPFHTRFFAWLYHRYHTSYDNTFGQLAGWLQRQSANTNTDNHTNIYLSLVLPQGWARGHGYTYILPDGDVGMHTLPCHQVLGGHRHTMAP